MAQEITLPVKLLLENLLEITKEMRSQLSTLKIDSSGYKKLDGVITDIEKRILQLQVTSSRPFIDAKQFTAVSKGIIGIEDDLTKIRIEASKIKFSDLSLNGALKAKLQEFDAEIKSINDLLKLVKDSAKNTFFETDIGKAWKLNHADDVGKTFTLITSKIETEIAKQEVALKRAEEAYADYLERLAAKRRLLEFIKNGHGLTKENLGEDIYNLIFDKNSNFKSGGRTALQTWLEELFKLDPAKIKELTKDAGKRVQEAFAEALGKVETTLKLERSRINANIKNENTRTNNGQSYALDIVEKQTALNAERAAKESINETNIKLAKTEEDLMKSSLRAKSDREAYVLALVRTANELLQMGSSCDAARTQLDLLNLTVDTGRAKLASLDQATSKLLGISNFVNRYVGAYAIIRKVSTAIRNAFLNIKELDLVITNIAVVTNMSLEDLWNKVGQYTLMALEYGVTTKDVYSVSLLFYQLGLQTSQVMDLTTETLKMAKIAGMDYTEATNAMTVAVRAFNIEMDNAQQVTDTYSALAAKFAVSSAEIANAMEKTASSAANVGMSIQSTSAFISVMEQTTRESALNIGSALKSIISRYGEMKASPSKLINVDGEDVAFNKVDTALLSVGISIKDAAGLFRDFDDVIMELALKWNTLDNNTQRYIATVMAGNRQLSRFIALVSNYDELKRAMATANEAENASIVQVAKTMDSLESKTNQLKNAFSLIYLDLHVEKGLKNIYDWLTRILLTIGKLGVLKGAIPTLVNLIGFGTGTKSLIRNLQDSIQAKKLKIEADNSEALNKIDEIKLRAEELLIAHVTAEVDDTQLKDLENRVNLLNTNINVLAATGQLVSTNDFYTILRLALLNGSLSTAAGRAQTLQLMGVLPGTERYAQMDEIMSHFNGLTPAVEALRAAFEGTVDATNTLTNAEINHTAATIADTNAILGENISHIEEGTNISLLGLAANIAGLALTDVAPPALEAATSMSIIGQTEEGYIITSNLLINATAENNNLTTASSNRLIEFVAKIMDAIRSLFNFSRKLDETSNLTVNDGKDIPLDTKKWFTSENTKLMRGLGIASSIMRMAGTAITAVGAATQDVSTSKTEWSKVWTGVGNGVSMAGTGAMMGMAAGPWGAIAGAIGGFLLGGLSTIIDGANMTLEELLALEKEEAKRLSDESLKKLAKTLDLSTSIDNLENLRKIMYNSNEDMEKYKDAMNTMASEYPSLISNYDEAGNAIIDLNAAEILLAETRLLASQAANLAAKAEAQTRQTTISTLNEAQQLLNDITGQYAGSAIYTDEAGIAHGFYSRGNWNDAVNALELVYGDISEWTFNTIIDKLINTDWNTVLVDGRGAMAKSWADVFKNTVINKDGSIVLNEGLEYNFEGIQELDKVNEILKNRATELNISPVMEVDENLSYIYGLMGWNSTIELTAENLRQFEAKLAERIEGYESIVATLDKQLPIMDALESLDSALLNEDINKSEKISTSKIATKLIANLIELAAKTLEGVESGGEWSRTEDPELLNIYLETKTEATNLIVNWLINLSDTALELTLSILGAMTDYRSLEDVFAQLGYSMNVEDIIKKNPLLSEEDAEKLIEDILKSFSDANIANRNRILNTIYSRSNNGKYIFKVNKELTGINLLENESLTLALKIALHFMEENEVAPIISKYADYFTTLLLAINDLANLGYTRLASTRLNLLNSFANLLGDITDSLILLDLFNILNLVDFSDFSSLADALEQIKSYLKAHNITDESDMTFKLLTTLLNALEQLIFNVNTLAQNLSDSITNAAKSIDGVLGANKSGFDLSKALEELLNLNIGKSVEEAFNFNDIFNFDAISGKYVYSKEGLKNAVSAVETNLDEIATKLDETVNNYLSVETLTGLKSYASDANNILLNLTEVGEELKAEDFTYFFRGLNLDAKSLALYEGLTNNFLTSGLPLTFESYLDYLIELTNNIIDSKEAIDLLRAQYEANKPNLLFSNIDWSTIALGTDYSKTNRMLADELASLLELEVGTAWETIVDTYLRLLYTDTEGNFNEAGYNIAKEKINSLILQLEIQQYQTTLSEILNSGSGKISLASLELARTLGIDISEIGLSADKTISTASKFLDELAKHIGEAGYTLELYNADAKSVLDKTLFSKKRGYLKTILDAVAGTFDSSAFENLANSFGKTLNDLINPETGELNALLAGHFTYNAMTNSYDVQGTFESFVDALANTLNITIDTSTKEYINALSTWNNGQIEKRKEIKENIIKELNAFSSADITSELNISWLLEILGKNLPEVLYQYGGVLKDGILSFTQDANIAEMFSSIVKLVKNIEDSTLLLSEDEIANLQDAIVSMLSDVVSLVNTGLEGKLTHTLFTNLSLYATQNGIGPLGYTETYEGIQLTEDGFAELYAHLSTVDKKLAKTLLPNITKMSKLYKTLGDVLKAYLEATKNASNALKQVLEDLTSSMLRNPENFNLMNSELPPELLVGENYYSSLSKGMQVILSMTKEGKASFSDFYALMLAIIDNTPNMEDRQLALDWMQLSRAYYFDDNGTPMIDVRAMGLSNWDSFLQLLRMLSDAHDSVRQASQLELKIFDELRYGSESLESAEIVKDGTVNIGKIKLIIESKTLLGENIKLLLESIIVNNRSLYEMLNDPNLQSDDESIRDKLIRILSDTNFTYEDFDEEAADVFTLAGLKGTIKLDSSTGKITFEEDLSKTDTSLVYKDGDLTFNDYNEWVEWTLAKQLKNFTPIIENEEIIGGSYQIDGGYTVKVLLKDETVTYSLNVPGVGLIECENLDQLDAAISLLVTSLTTGDKTIESAPTTYKVSHNGITVEVDYSSGSVTLVSGKASTNIDDAQWYASIELAAKGKIEEEETKPIKTNEPINVEASVLNITLAEGYTATLDAEQIILSESISNIFGEGSGILTKCTMSYDGKNTIIKDSTGKVLASIQAKDLTGQGEGGLTTCTLLYDSKTSTVNVTADGPIKGELDNTIKTEGSGDVDTLNLDVTDDTNKKVDAPDTINAGNIPESTIVNTSGTADTFTASIAVTTKKTANAEGTVDVKNNDITTKVTSDADEVIVNADSSTKTSANATGPFNANTDDPTANLTTSADSVTVIAGATTPVQGIASVTLKGSFLEDVNAELTGNTTQSNCTITVTNEGTVQVKTSSGSTLTGTIDPSLISALTGTVGANTPCTVTYNGGTVAVTVEKDGKTTTIEIDVSKYLKSKGTIDTIAVEGNVTLNSYDTKNLGELPQVDVGDIPAIGHVKEVEVVYDEDPNEAIKRFLYSHKLNISGDYFLDHWDQVGLEITTVDNTSVVLANENSPIYQYLNSLLEKIKNEHKVLTKFEQQIITNLSESDLVKNGNLSSLVSEILTESALNSDLLDPMITNLTELNAVPVDNLAVITALVENLAVALISLQNIKWDTVTSGLLLLTSEDVSGINGESLLAKVELTPETLNFVDKVKELLDEKRIAKIDVDLGKDSLTNAIDKIIKTIESTRQIKLKVVTEETSSGAGGNALNNRRVSADKFFVKPADALGNVALAGGRRQTLMGELGPELYVLNGHYYIAGAQGPEMVSLDDDAIVFNHIQTRRLMAKGSTYGHGKPVTNEYEAAGMSRANGLPNWTLYLSWGQAKTARDAALRQLNIFGDTTEESLKSAVESLNTIVKEANTWMTQYNEYILALKQAAEALEESAETLQDAAENTELATKELKKAIKDSNRLHTGYNRVNSDGSVVASSANNGMYKATTPIQSWGSTQVGNDSYLAKSMKQLYGAINGASVDVEKIKQLVSSVITKLLEVGFESIDLSSDDFKELDASTKSLMQEYIKRPDASYRDFVRLYGEKAGYTVQEFNEQYFAAWQKDNDIFGASSEMKDAARNLSFFANGAVGGSAEDWTTLFGNATSITDLVDAGIIDWNAKLGQFVITSMEKLQEFDTNLDIEEFQDIIADGLRTTMSNMMDLVSKGVSGSLSHEELGQLNGYLETYNLPDISKNMISETTDGLKVSNEYLFHFYDQLKKVDALQARIAFKLLKQSLEESNDNFKTMDRLLGHMSELLKKIQDTSKYSDEKILLYQEELELCLEIAAVRATTEDNSMNFLDLEIPGGMNNPLNYITSWATFIKDYRQAAEEGGAIDFKEMYNAMNHMSNLASIVGKPLDFLGNQLDGSAEKIHAAMMKLVGSLGFDSEGNYGVLLDKFAADFTNGVDGFAASAKEGLKTMAESLIKILDGLIAMFEAIAAMESFKGADIDLSGTLDFKEIFIDTENLEKAILYTDAYTKCAQEMSEKLGDNSILAQTFENIKVNGYSLKAIIEDAITGVKSIDISSLDLTAIMSKLFEGLSTDDYSKTDIANSLNDWFAGIKLSEATTVDLGDVVLTTNGKIVKGPNSTFITPGGQTFGTVDDAITAAALEDLKTGKEATDAKVELTAETDITITSSALVTVTADTAEASKSVDSLTLQINSISTSIDVDLDTTLAYKDLNKLIEDIKAETPSVDVTVSKATTEAETENNESSATGNAMAGGTKETLMGELGPELYVTNGHYYVAGQNGAEFVKLPKDAIVFNHLLTLRLLNTGSSGRGKPITNERNAVSLARGTTGPAAANVQETLNVLYELRAMWQTLADMSVKDLAGLGASKDSSDGGDSSKPASTWLALVERWYDLLQKIARLEKEINYQEALRNKLESDRVPNGKEYFDTLVLSLDNLKQLALAHKELAESLEDYFNQRREELNKRKSPFAKFYTFDEGGQLKYSPGAFDKLSDIVALDEWGRPKYTPQQQYDLMKSYGFESYMKYDNSGNPIDLSEEGWQLLAVQAVWERMEAELKEMQTLYDSKEELKVKYLDSINDANKLLLQMVDNQIDLEKLVISAIEERELAVIDALSDERLALADSTNAYIKGLLDSLDKERKMREKNDSDLELSKLLSRLSMLQRGGGSAAEIANLQREISDKQTDMYFDAQSQQIEAIQDASDLLLEKLQTQIDLMSESLAYAKENGLLWAEATEIMKQNPEFIALFITDNSPDFASQSVAALTEELRKILFSAEQFASYYDYIESLKEGKTPLNNTLFDLNTAINDGFEIVVANDENKEKLAYEELKKLREEEALRWEVELEQRKADEKAQLNAAAVAHENEMYNLYGAALGMSRTKWDELRAKGRLTDESLQEKYNIDGITQKILELQMDMYQEMLRNKDNPLYSYWSNLQMAETQDQIEALEALRDKLRFEAYAKELGYTKRYAHGGLVNYTGLAMVHGSDARPEAFLNADEVKVWKEDILGSSSHSLTSQMLEMLSLYEKFNSTISSTYHNNSEGINIERVDVNMNVALLANDYDARRAGREVMNEILNIANKSSSGNRVGR